MSRRLTPIATYQNTALIYNPEAGGILRRPRRLERTVAVLRERGHGVELVPTAGPGTAGEIASACAARGADLILIAGGDGTLNEAINGLAGRTTPVALLPAGTANVLAHEIHIGSSMRRAARELEDWVPARISLGVLEATGLPAPRYFLLMAGAGLDARIIRSVNPGLKRVMGRFAYWLAGFAEIGQTLEPFEVRMGSTVRQAGFALASRVRNYGGDLEIALGASLMDDTFEVVVFEGTSPLRYLVYLGGVAFKRLNTLRGVTIVKAEQLELPEPEGGAVELQVDGELAGSLPARISIAPAALTLLVPPQFLHAVRDRAWITSRIPSPA